MARPLSAGVLAWRRRDGRPEFLLVHPGGPYWASKDEAAWSIPKGLVAPREDPWTAALREFAEELGPAIARAIGGPGEPLSPCRTPGGKIVQAWLVEADLDLSVIESAAFEMEWPPRSGRIARFPEVDRAEYFPPETALWKAHKGQRPLIREALARLAEADQPSGSSRS